MNYIKTFEKFLWYKYSPSARNFDIETIDLQETDIFKEIIKKGDNIPKEDLDKLNKFFRDNKYKAIKLYHGTSSEYNIENEGLLKTKLSTKKSLQSEPGYVYLSLYKDMAKTFAQIAYPNKDVTVYEVHIQIASLLADKDQIRNKRLYGKMDLKDSLAESVLYGSGFRVKSDIPPYMIKDKFIYETK